MFKIHDKISDLFGIRRHYDKKVMVAEILKCAEIEVNINTLNAEQVKKAMSVAFYRYASSTDPKIDKHYIYLAINEWCWYWIVLDTTALIILIGWIFIIIKWSWLNLLFIIIIITTLYILMKLLKYQVKVYSKDEIAAIFWDSERKSNIIKELNNALSCK